MIDKYHRGWEAEKDAGRGFFYGEARLFSLKGFDVIDAALTLLACILLAGFGYIFLTIFADVVLPPIVGF